MLFHRTPTWACGCDLLPCSLSLVPDNSAVKKNGTKMKGEWWTTMLKKSNELGPGTASLISCEQRVHLRAECELQACEKPAHTKKVSPLHATGNHLECRQFCGDPSSLRGRRKKGRRFPLSPIPLLFPPYPLPLSTPASQAMIRQSVVSHGSVHAKLRFVDQVDKIWICYL